MIRVRLAGVAFGTALLVATLAGGARDARAQATPETEFIYRFQPRDTLIGLSRRLLLQPRRWPELQARNHIANPLDIAPDTPLRIPYSWLKLTTESAQVLTTSGEVTHGGTAVAAGEQLPEGTVVTTGADGSLTLQFADGSTVTLQKASVLRLDHLQRVDGVPDGHSVRLRLESGRAESKVKPKRDVGRFEISTPVAVSAVRGTQFRTSFTADGGNATTETTDGTVNVAAPSAAVAIPAGFGTRVEESGSLLPPTPLLAAPDVSAVPATNARPALDVRLGAVAGAVSYRVQVARDAEFHSIVADNQTPEPAARLDTLPEGMLWLRARAIDRFGLEGLDAVREFSQHRLPPAPRPIAPAADSRTSGPTTIFEWNEVPDAARYHLQVARDADFSDVVIDRDVTAATRASAEGVAANPYFWRIATVNAQGEAGDWSPTSNYQQRPLPPAMAPPVIEKRQMRFHWDERAGSTYRVQIARDAGFRHLVLDTRTAAAALDTRRLFPGAYFVRVQAIDGAEVADPFGEPRRFSVAIPTWMKIVLGGACVVPLL